MSAPAPAANTPPPALAPPPTLAAVAAAPATRERIAVLRALVPGAVLGFSLGFIGFGDFGEVHRMFTFADLRLMLTFAGGVALTAAGMAWFARGKALPRRGVRKETVLGSVLFGAGWAVAGACPGIVLVQLGEGRLYGLLTFGGILAGTAAAGWYQRARRGAAESC